MAGRHIFRRGEFHLYIVAREELHLGGKLATTLQEGDQVLFDGYTVKFDGADYVMPQVKGAIKEQWLVREDLYDGGFDAPPPQPAGVRVRPAQDAGREANRRPMGMPTVQEEERFVGNFRRIRDATKEARRPMSREEKMAQRGQRTAHRQHAYEVEDANDGRIVDYLDSPAPPPQPVRAQRRAPRRAPRAVQQPTAQDTREHVLDNHGQQGVAVKQLGKPTFDSKVTANTRVPKDPNYSSLNGGRVGIE